MALLPKIPLFLLLFFFFPGSFLPLALLLQEKPTKHILLLSPSSPYEEGKQQGEYYKEEIQSFCQKPLQELKKKLLLRKIDIERQTKKIERKIGKKYRDEMQGIADGSGASYKEILLLNILPEMVACGCSVVGVVEHQLPLLATNHFPSLPSKDKNSQKRSQQLENSSIRASVGSLKKALKNVNLLDTLQAIVFDVKEKSIHLALGSSFAAQHPYLVYSRKDLFSQEEVPPISKKIFLARTLDWPMHFLGPKTILLIRKKTSEHHATAIVTWPGFIGAFSGLNDRGFCLAMSAVAGKMQIALPNSIFFRELLESCSCIQEASLFLKNQKVSFCMNLALAGSDGLLFSELDPNRNKKGASIIQKVN
jgi:hypothetical protein